jgi:hypothetical protein
MLLEAEGTGYLQLEGASGGEDDERLRRRVLYRDAPSRRPGVREQDYSTVYGGLLQKFSVSGLYYTRG